MATILVVDDRAANRELLATILGYRGHRVVEASDGAEALSLVKAERPNLIISDILMPTMDGYEFVRRLRADPETANIPVIFNTAHYLDREATVLAKACGVTQIIYKPVEPEMLLSAVDAALGLTQSAVPPPPQEFNQEHMQLLTDKLAQKTDDVRRTNERLSALIELGNQIAGEHNPLHLLENFCHAARSIIGAKYAAIAVLDDGGVTLRHFLTSGLEPEVESAIGPPPVGRGLLGCLLKRGGSLRTPNIEGHPQSEGFPPNHPKMTSFLGAAISSSSGIYGSLYLTDKLGFEEFSEADEKLVTMLAAQVGIAYENAKRYEQLQWRAAELQDTALLRGRAEQELRLTQHRLRDALASSPAVIYTLTTEGDLPFPTWVSENVTWVLGYETEECLTKDWWIRGIHPDDREREVSGLSDLRATGHRISDYRFLHKDGSYRWVRDEQRLLRNDQAGPAEIVGAWVDISERKLAEEALVQTNETLGSLIQASPLAIISTDVQGNVTTWNSAAERIFGWSTKEVVGRPYPIVPSDQTNEIESGLDALQSRGTLTEFETRRNRKDGKSVDVSISSSALRGVSGDFNGVVSVIADITERKQLEEQFRQSQKMEAVGRLAGGIAHDFNNLLTAIIGYSQIALSRLKAEDPMRKDIEEVEKAGQRAATLTSQLLAFSRKQVLQPRILDLNAVVAELNKLLQRVIGEDVELVISLDKSIGFVKADPGQIEQIIMNLAVNSRDALPKGGKLLIETANVDLDENYADEHVDARVGAHVMLAISDNGSGMDKETQLQIFEPFFTTKGQGKGTGLGLSTVYGIVKQSGGHVGVYSEPGHGTIIKVYLPRVDEISDHRKPRLRQVDSQGTETILLVEDEVSVRLLARTILESNGYKVLEADAGEKVRQICKEHRGPIHLMLTDVVMPGMGGRELAELVATLRPETKILYMSGYTDDAIVHHGVLGPDKAFIQKPFTPSGLTTKVRQVLGKAKRVSRQRG